MANANGSIDEIIGQEARNQVQETTNLLKLMVDEFKVAVTQAKSLNTEISNAKGLAQMTTALEKMNITTAKATEATNKAAVAYEKLRQQEQITATKLEQTATQQAKTDKEKVNIEKAKLDLRLKEEAAAQKAIANLSKETKAAEIQASAYIKLRDAHKLAEKAALEAGVTYGKNSTQFKLAAAESNNLRNQFVSLHQELGNNRDNVGNYGSAIGKVWGGIRQLAYILPGLGIAGIFNLAGEAIIYAADKLEIFKSGLNDVVDPLSAMNKAVEGSEYKNAVTSISSMKEEILLANKGFIDKTETLDKYNETLGKTIGKATDLNEAESLIVKNGSAYIRMTTLKAAANLALDEAAKEALKAEKMRLAMLNQTDRNGNVHAGGFKSLMMLFTEGLGSDEENMNKQVKKIENKGKELENVGKGLLDEAAKVASTYNMDYYGGDIKHPTTAKPKEVNRIDDIKKEYEKEKLAIEKKFDDGFILEVDYRNKLIELDNKYATTKIDSIDKLSKKEQESAVSFEETLRKSNNQNLKAIEDYYKNVTKDLEEYDKFVSKLNKEKEKDDKEASDNFQKLEDEDLKYMKGNASNIIKANKDKNDEIIKAEKAAAEKKKAYLEAYLQIFQASLDIIGSISDGLAAKEMQRLDARDKALSESYKNELRFIEQSGFSNEQKEKKKAKLAAETEAKQKQIDRDRVTALRKQAVLNKALSIVSIIAKTAEAIMANLSIPIYGEIKAAAAAAIGAAELAAVIATPLPQYAKGRKGGKAEHAIVGEIGQEAIVTTDGKVTLTPSTPSLAYIPQGADVIPHNELIKNSAYVALAKQGTVTTDKLQMALIAEFEKNTEKIDELINVTKSKNLTATYNGLGGFESYKQANIR